MVRFGASGISFQWLFHPLLAETKVKESAIYWFNSYYPEMATGMPVEEQLWIDRLNRIGIGYFRPLVMSILKNEKNEKRRIQAFKKIERFIFIDFRLNTAQATHGSSEFYNAARALDRGETSLEKIFDQLDWRLSYTFNSDKSFQSLSFYNFLFKKFKNGSGYYGWSYLRYFLYEYETSLLTKSRQKKVDWSDLLKTEEDKISIEHIYPQTESKEWASIFASVKKENRPFYSASLGNLLLLSMAINSSLQNDSFDQKKHVKFDSNGKKIRNGYEDGSHSEIEVSLYSSWGPEQIRERGLKLLKFMEERWDLHFKNDEEREKLLFLDNDD